MKINSRIKALKKFLCLYPEKMVKYIDIKHKKIYNKQNYFENNVN